MTDIRSLKDPSGNVFYPQTHAQAIIGLAALIISNLKVTSVNQKTGDVVLTASDVGATTAEDIAEAIQAIQFPVTSVAGKTGAVTLEKLDVGLDQVDNTADEDKPVSTAQQAELDKKQDKILVSPNGSKFVLSVADDGTLSTEPYVEGSGS